MNTRIMQKKSRSTLRLLGLIFFVNFVLLVTPSLSWACDQDNEVEIYSADNQVVRFPDYLRRTSSIVKIHESLFAREPLHIPAWMQWMDTISLDQLRQVLEQLPQIARDAHGGSVDAANIDDQTIFAHALVNQVVKKTLPRLSPTDLARLFKASDYFNISVLRDTFAQLMADHVIKTCVQEKQSYRSVDSEKMEKMFGIGFADDMQYIDKYIYLLRTQGEEQTVADYIAMHGQPVVTRGTLYFMGGTTTKRITSLQGLDYIEGKEEIHSIHIENNGILGSDKDPDFPSSPFHSFPHLTHLVIKDNPHLTLIPSKMFSIPSLQKLEMTAQHQMTRLSPKIFQDLANVEEINLSSNGLKTLSKGIFQGLKKLKVLKLEKNRLGDLPIGLFQGLNQLQEMDLKDNQIKRIQEGLWEGLDRLQSLDLSNNELCDLPSKALSGMPCLRQLNLAWNKIQEVSKEAFSGLSKLENLNLWQNQLDDFPTDALEGLTGLKKLDLKSNKIRCLPEDFLCHVPGLEHLYLWNNVLKRLPSRVLRRIPDTLHVHLLDA